MEKKNLVPDIEPYVEVKFGRESVPVNCFDLQGHFVKHFNSIVEASKEMKVTSSGIGVCLKKGKGRAGQYQWRKA